MESATSVSTQTRARFFVLKIFIICIFCFLTINLFLLQIIRGGEFKKMSKTVSHREISIPTQRGEIYDRSFDIPLATNLETFSISVIPGQIPGEIPVFFEKLARVLNIDVSQIHSRVPLRAYTLYQPIEIATGVSIEKISQIAEHIEEFPGVTWNANLKRVYLETGSLSHVIGYVGNIDESELELKYAPGQYDRNSIVGKTGLEKQYDSILRGKNGIRYSLVDVYERRIDAQAEEQPPELGMHIVLTIDRRIQLLGEKALGPQNGAVVVMKPDTGEIVSLVSTPSFNSNLFLNKDYYDKLRLDPDNPLYNRSISPFPPASSFKMIMATAVAQEEVFPVDKTVFCSGELRVGNRVFHCWKKSGHGALDLIGGIANSCNVYFQTMGLKYLGVENIVTYAHEYGLGEITGIDLPDEKSGFVPTPEWKEKTENTPWVGGDTVNFSIGQGYVTATPLQMANVVAMIANEGTTYVPRLLKEVRDPKTGKVESVTERKVLRKNERISADTFHIVQRGMRAVVETGTARYVLTTKAVDVAGKTGTSELASDKSNFTHEWFCGYAPYSDDSDAERMVVIVFVEGVPKNEWWSPRIANYIFHGIYTGKTFEEVEREFGILYPGKAGTDE
ncbi:MAG: penicillin-binding protein 2 [Spirochaetales bacterium]|nr:penicillin-binding protein 2 [Spirochaetales bacterium]